MGRAHHEETVELANGMADVFDAAVAAIGRFRKMAVRVAEKDVGLIVVVKAVGLASWGELIVIKMREAPDNRTSVWVWSETLGRPDLLRINRRNVLSLIGVIREELALRCAPPDAPRASIPPWQ